MTLKRVADERSGREIFEDRTFELIKRVRESKFEEEFLATVNPGLQLLMEKKAVMVDENAIVKKTFQEIIIPRTAKLLFRRFGKKIDIDPLPEEFIEENLARWEKFNLKPVFFPGEEIFEGRNLRNWTMPPQKFYQWMRDRKIDADSAKLRRGWYLADFTKNVDYTDGTQVLPDDPFSPIIERLRKDGKVGKYDKTPMGSRFSIVPNNEWPIVLAEIAKELGLRSGQVTLERYIEFNFIGNLYDKNRGKFNIWEWFADRFGGAYRLNGGFRDDGGLAGVDDRGAGDRSSFIAGRPLVSFIKVLG